MGDLAALISLRQSGVAESHSLSLCGLCYQQGRSALQNVPGSGWSWVTWQRLGGEINAGTRVFESVTA